MAGLVDNRKVWDRLKRELARANSLEVAVGLFSGKVNDKGKEVVEYATYNEFGIGVPSRPFMSISFDENISSINKTISEETSKILAGNSTVKTSLANIGKIHKDNIRNVIENVNILPKLAESTVRKKKSTKTLIDTRALVDSVTYKVRKKS